jgi:membrane protein implicated in regulation of membrane protease activity
MSPIVLTAIVLGIIILDFVVDLQLYGLSLALSIGIVASLEFFGLQLELWQLVGIFSLLVALFAVVTRKIIKKNDNDDINKY